MSPSPGTDREVLSSPAQTTQQHPLVGVAAAGQLAAELGGVTLLRAGADRSRSSKICCKAGFLPHCRRTLLYQRWKRLYEGRGMEAVRETRGLSRYLDNAQSNGH